MPDFTLSALPKFWQIWRNPIFIRYRRAKLRISALITGALLYGGLSVFILLVSIGMISQQFKMSFEQKAIFPFIAMVVLQIMILNFGGTGAVASGMARESIDDVLTYQRLTPLSPLTKIIGYLTGLPIRQYYHFMLTVPVTIWIIVFGEIDQSIWLPIYAVLFTSTIMFHLLAMMVGFIMGKKFSMIISQGLVALLYFAFPQLSKFGFVIFEYLTIRPAFILAIQRKIPELELRGETALFFDWEISHTWYSILIQSLLCLIFLAILLRRWRHENAHLLSKAQSVIICVLAHVLILGGIWANTSSGEIFNIEINTQRPEGIIAEEAVKRYPEYVASTVIGIYGLISLAIAILLQYLYTPEKFTYYAGIRQRLKDGKNSVALLSDSASAIPTTILTCLISVGMWLIYTRHILNTPQMTDYLSGRSYRILEVLILIVLASPLLGHGFALEKWGRKLIGTLALFLWVIPLAIAILGSAWNFNPDVFGLLYGLSPLAMVFSPAFGLTHMDYLLDRPFIVGSILGSVCYLTIAVTSIVLIQKRHQSFMQHSLNQSP